MTVQKRDNAGVCQGEAVEIHGQRLGLHLVCDSAYSLLALVDKDIFILSFFDWSGKKFKYLLSHASVVVEIPYSENIRGVQFSHFSRILTSLRNKKSNLSVILDSHMGINCIHPCSACMQTAVS